LNLEVPLVSGALGKFDGQVSLFPNDGHGPCYQCFVPEIPPDAETCAQLGIIGALAGLIGSMMAMETIKHITKAGETLSGRIWLYDGLSAKSRVVKISKDQKCKACKS
jgi:molybdopterin/thiamine biosynthesis adenylyltransferase